jgi:hypothetical protein
VIGVYEPLVAVADGRTLETSLAAHPQAAKEAACFHRTCYGDPDGGASPGRLASHRGK